MIAATKKPDSPARPDVVLVVDDDYDIREALSDVLVSEGYSVVTAADGREALDQLIF
jgi:CheY-like chemotaxis protein